MKEISILRLVVGLLLVGTVKSVESMVNFCGVTRGPAEGVSAVLRQRTVHRKTDEPLLQN